MFHIILMRLSYNLALLSVHQIREFRENLGVLFSIRENQRKKKAVVKIREVLEVLLFDFRVVTFSVLSHTSSGV